VLKSDNTLWGTGGNTNGQLGIGNLTPINRFTQIMENISQLYLGVTATFIMKADGTLWVTGDNQFGQLGTGVSEKNVVNFKQVILPTE